MPTYHITASSESIELTEYFWRAPFSPPVPADTFKEHFDRLHEDLHGPVRPQDLVEYARAETNELHQMFEWDNAIAGERYRTVEARAYMGALKIRVPPNPTRANVATAIRVLVNVGTGDNQGYVTIKSITEGDVEREIYLDSFRDARHVVEKYQNIADARLFVLAAQHYLKTYEDDAREAGVNLSTPYQLPKAGDLVNRRRIIDA